MAGPRRSTIVRIMTKLSALGVVLLALVAASPASGKGGDFYALRYGAKMNLLLPFDPVHMVPSGKAIRLGGFAHAWSISPDRSRFVVAPSSSRATPDGSAGLRFVDLVDGRVEGTMVLPGEQRRVTATAWVRGRVLAVVSGSESSTVYAVDPRKRTVISQVELPGAVVLGERTAARVVLLLATPGLIGPAKVAVVDQTPRVRIVELDRIAIGTTFTGTGSDRGTIVERPGLALAPSGLRAFVFGADEATAVVDLRTLSVRYPPVRTIAAAAKQAVGFVRSAAALPEGRFVVSGYRLEKAGSATLQLVSPSDWSSRPLVAPTSWFRVGGGLVFTQGTRGTGLRILRPSGATRELFQDRSIRNVFVIGPRAFVSFVGPNQQAAIVELGTGRVVRQTVPAHPLIGAGQEIFFFVG